MKSISKKHSYIQSILVFILLFLTTSCSKTSSDFQKDADIIRLRHLNYYGNLIEEYKQITGQYPFQGKDDVPIYVYVANDEQEEFTKGGPPYSHSVISFKKLVTELEHGLHREISEYYDPQYRPDNKPNYYIYMINRNTYFFAIHVHQPFPFARKISKNYYKIELSNNANQKDKASNPQQLLNSQEFIAQLNMPNSKEGFFKERENKYLHYTKSVSLN